jgi:HlyD family secretion protein
MFQNIQKLFQLLSKKSKIRFYRLQLLIVFMTLLEICGVASMAPFMALVGDLDVLDGNTQIAKLYQNIGISSKEDFLFIIGMSVFCIMTLAACISIFTIWRLSLFASEIGVEISDRLYIYYLNESYLFHTLRNSAQLTKQISTEAGRMAILVVSPLLQIGAKLVFTTFMCIAIFLYNPQIAITIMLFFTISYWTIFKLVRPFLEKNGREISKQLQARFNLMSDGFGGIKDILLLNRKKYYEDKFLSSGKIFARSQGTNQAFSLIPKYIMELLAFGVIIILILFLIKTYKGDLSEILPILTVYSLAGFKLLPAFQNIYANFSHIKGNIASFEEISSDLEKSYMVNSSKDVSSNKKIDFHKSLEFKDISFSYPGKHEQIFNNFSLKIPKNNVIGIVGPSGSGKSTFIDILLGLIKPDEGEILIDGNCIDKKNIRSWQNIIGFVPQSVYLLDGSIMENIAIGIPKKEIDEEKIMNAIEKANLLELIQSYDDGIHSQVGERGIQLSGGQRQRISIARALYEDAEVLVFDEATSALDGMTEQLVMKAVNDFSGTKTIIMVAHRLTTVENCDIIYFIENGSVQDSGTYKDLIKKNKVFRKMANANE